MPLFRATTLFFIFAILTSFTFVSVTMAAGPVASNAANDIDRSTKPGDDFYRYANGAWLKTAAIPANASSFDTRAILTERTSQRVRDLIQAAAAQNATRGSITQKVGDYYA